MAYKSAIRLGQCKIKYVDTYITGVGRQFCKRIFMFSFYVFLFGFLAE